MEMFDNIEAYYNFLEKDKGLLNDPNLSNELINLRDKNKVGEIKSVYDYELFFTDFSFQKGKIAPQIKYTNGDAYPSFSLFDDDLKYIQLRAGVIKNPKYKAKYNHLLWESKHKHIDYAKKAIDNYYFLLNDNFLLSEDNLQQIAFENYFKNMFILSQAINYKKDEVLNFLVSILNSQNLNGFRSYSLINFVLNEGKQIDTSIFQFLYSYCGEVINSDRYKDCIEQYLKLAIVLCSKLEISPTSFHNILAAFYVKKAEETAESFIAHDFYLKALTNYQKAGNKNKKEETSVSLEKTKKGMKFKSIAAEDSDEQLQEWAEKLNIITDELIENFSSKEIFEYIINPGHIFPKAEALNDNARPMMFDYITVKTFDINKNIRNGNAGINIYWLYIQNFTLRQLHQIFLKGYKNGKISYKTLVDYLTQYSWYGSHHEEENYNWIELLSPALNSFFKQSEIDIRDDRDSNAGYILAIDSLVIKFEGLLREFSKKIGAQTVEIKEGGTQERISFDKLLENPKLIELMPADDIALLKFLFTADWMNLRNNIAHSFYKTEHYCAGVMFLLIAALLKLGNYSLLPLMDRPA
jgi:uncharacterized protein DUF4209